MNKQEAKRVANTLNEWGFVLLPLYNKLPAKDTGGWQNRTLDSFNENEYKDGSNIGIVLGKESKAIVVDLDPCVKPKRGETLEHDGINFFNYLTKKFEPIDTYTVHTGKGYHYYFKYDERMDIFTSNSRILKLGNKKITIDVKANRSYVVAPGSVHPVTKSEYKIINGIKDGKPDLKDMPDWLFNILEKGISKGGKITYKFLRNEEMRHKKLPLIHPIEEEFDYDNDYAIQSQYISIYNIDF